MSEWRPISSAPKTGWILVYDLNVNGCHVACWRADCEDFVPEGWDGFSDTIDADFWMPLPAPPPHPDVGGQ